MLNLLEWNSKIRVNGQIFNSSTEAYENFKDFTGEIKIELNFKDVSHGTTDNIKIDGDLYYF